MRILLGWLMPHFRIPSFNLIFTSRSPALGISAPGRWGHRSPLPQYRLARTGVAIAKRRARKARFWRGDGNARP